MTYAGDYAVSFIYPGTYVYIPRENIRHSVKYQANIYNKSKGVLARSYLLLFLCILQSLLTEERLNAPESAYLKAIYAKCQDFRSPPSGLKTNNGL